MKLEIGYPPFGSYERIRIIKGAGCCVDGFMGESSVVIGLRAKVILLSRSTVRNDPAQRYQYNLFEFHRRFRFGLRIVDKKAI
jgi:hypothetical protein